MQDVKAILLPIILILFILSCKNQSSDLIGKTNAYAIKSKKISPENAKWAYKHNLQSPSLNSFYNEKAIKILPDGEVINGAEKVAGYNLMEEAKITSIKNDISILANERRKIEYEILEITLDNKEKQKSLVIWQTQDSVKRRIFEFTAPLIDPVKNEEALDQRRELWIKLCNEHDATRLINELYSENTLYFNHKPVIQGRENLVKEYQYMNNSQYTLTLKPIIVEPVNEDFIFEIGQCSGSYGGNYILIWRKDPDRKWRIFIDSNI